MKKYILKNGIPIILEQMPGTQTITALVLFKVGSRNESQAVNGVSHFIEHLFFKGTQKRPSSFAIAKELDGVGAEFNAFTGKDFTGYYIKVARKHLVLATDILEDLLFHPIFDQKEIDKERGVIIEEINLYEDIPMRSSEEIAEQLMFGAQHPLGYFIIGSKENIRHFSREQIITYRDRYYHPGNMVIIFAGNLPSKTMKIVHEKFHQTPQNENKIPQLKKFVDKQSFARIKIKYKKTAQAHLALAFPAVGYNSAQLVVAKVLATILGGGMSSRLFINVRDKQGLCYYIGAENSPYQETGAFVVRAGFDVTRLNQALRAIIKELQDIKQQPVLAEELAKAKEYIIGKTAIYMEDSEFIANWWGSEMLFQKKYCSPKKYATLVRAVTVKQVQNLANKILQARKANLAIIGPYSKKQENKFKRYL